MSYRTVNTCTVGKGIRSGYRTQLNRIRCTSAREAMEYWDTEVESGRHPSSFPTTESPAGRRSFAKVVGRKAPQR